MSARQMRVCSLERTCISANALVKGLAQIEREVQAVGGVMDREGTFCASVLRSMKPYPSGRTDAWWDHRLLASYLLPLDVPDPFENETTKPQA